jgi:hypothetical protein
VLRRYFAGYSLLSEFVLQEAEACGHTGGSTLQQLLCGQAAIFDRLIEAVSDEHCRGAAGRLCSAEQRRTDRIERLLAGEPLDTSELHYDFEGDHLGAIAEGEGAAGFLRDLARELDRQLLLIYSRNDTVWAWLGGKHRLETSPLDHVAEDRLSTLCLAIGEPASGLEGWRLTHRQAKAALPFAHHAPRSLARYGEVALQASMLGDELLAASLRELYLTPLQSERDEGRAAIETLRAYFAVERNISSAGAMLGVKRHTVTNRLRAIERRLGRPLSTCSAELEAALCLENWEKTRLYERSPPG